MNAKALAVLLPFCRPPPPPKATPASAPTPTGFTPVTAPADLAFPRDHAPHPGFRIEWWYVTANLAGPDGTPYGAQWTLFRQAMAPAPDGNVDTQYVNEHPPEALARLTPNRDRAGPSAIPTAVRPTCRSSATCPRTRSGRG